MVAAGLGRNRPGEHALLQVNQHQGGCFRIELHGASCRLARGAPQRRGIASTGVGEDHEGMLIYLEL